MRGITLSLMVVLAMSSVALGQVTLDYSCTNYNPGDGYKTYTVTATGTNIVVLSDFTVTGGVHQVWVDATNPTPNPLTDLSEWINNSNGKTPANDMDSYVLFGDNRLGDWPNPGPPTNTSVTAETISAGAWDGTDYVGLGTLNNNATATNDAYVNTDHTYQDLEQTVGLLQLVIPDGASVNAAVTLYTADVDGSGYYTNITPYNLDIDVNCVLDGDANEDGISDLSDLSILASNYNQSGKVWATGDFNGDGNADLSDLSILASNYNQAADWYTPSESAGAAVPEPGTIMMLVLGSLCLLGYRLRK